MRGYAVFLAKCFLRLQDFAKNRATSEDLRSKLGFFIFRGAILVHALQNSVLHPRIGRHGRHRIRFVHDGNVVEDIFAVLVHAPNAVLDYYGNFVRKRRIVGPHRGNGQRENVTVAVLMLESFARESRASSGAAEHESATAHVRSGPDEVADPLQAEHRVINKKRDRVDSVSGVGGAGGDERGHRSRFGNSFLENLAVFRFLVIKQGVLIDRLVELPAATVDAYLSEERFHTEGASFIGDDRNYEFADFRVAQHLPQHADERHGRRDFAAFTPGQKLAEQCVMVRHERLGTNFASRNIAAQFLAARAQILDFAALFRRAVERRVGQLIVVNGNTKTRSEFAEFVFIEFFLLVGDISALTAFAQAI